MASTHIPSPTLARRKLPIGIQTFSEIIEEGYYYVDKTRRSWTSASRKFSLTTKSVWASPAPMKVWAAS
jgi:hypothetical protein